MQKKTGFGKSWILFLAGIKHYTETDESATKETKLDLSAVD